MVARWAVAVCLCAGMGMAWAQTPAPPEATDQALRARVTQFLQGFVDKQYRKVLPLVADDTQDEFFAMPKSELKSFQIDKIVYNKDFTRATVTCNVVKIWRVQGVEFNPQAPLDLTWKIENGNWVWYHELTTTERVTPMGIVDATKLIQKGEATQPQQLPKITQSAIDTAGLTLMRQASLDKSEITLASDQPSSATVTVKNGAAGRVELSLVALPNIPGFNATLDKTSIDGNASAVVRVEYNPSDAAPATLGPVSFAVLVSPFNQQLAVQVKFERAK